MKRFNDGDETPLDNYINLDKAFNPIFYLLTGIPPMEMSSSKSFYLECKKSNKFYEVKLDGMRVGTRFGEIGTKGAVGNDKVHLTEKAAKDYAETLLAEKINDGYLFSVKDKPAAQKRTAAQAVESADESSANPPAKKARLELHTLPNLEVGELQKLLEERGLDTEGTKVNLMARIAVSDMRPEYPDRELHQLLESGGTYYESDDFPMGPVRGITSSQVKDWSVALERISEKEFIDRYDPELVEQEAMGVGEYECDSDNDNDGGNVELEYLLIHFRSLKEFLKKAAEQGHAVLLWLS